MTVDHHVAMRTRTDLVLAQGVVQGLQSVMNLGVYNQEGGHQVIVVEVPGIALVVRVPEAILSLPAVRGQDLIHGQGHHAPALARAAVRAHVHDLARIPRILSTHGVEAGLTLGVGVGMIFATVDHAPRNTLWCLMATFIMYPFFHYEIHIGIKIF